MGNFENLGIVPQKFFCGYYRVCVRDGNDSIFFHVPPHFLLNFVEITLASLKSVEVIEFIEDNHGNKSVSK